MNEEDIKQIKEWSEDYRVVPSEDVWQQVESKLAQNDLAQTVQYYRWFAVAASFVAIVAVTLLWSTSSSTPSEDVYAYTTEDLPIADDPLYSAKTIRLLLNSY